MTDYQLDTIVDGGLERALTILLIKFWSWELIHNFMDGLIKKRASNYLDIYFWSNSYSKLICQESLFLSIRPTKTFFLSWEKYQIRAARFFLLPWEVLKKKVGQHKPRQYFQLDKLVSVFFGCTQYQKFKNSAQRGTIIIGLCQVWGLT